MVKRGTWKIEIVVAVLISPHVFNEARKLNDRNVQSTVIARLHVQRHDRQKLGRSSSWKVKLSVPLGVFFLFLSFFSIKRSTPSSFSAKHSETISLLAALQISTFRFVRRGKNLLEKFTAECRARQDRIATINIEHRGSFKREIIETLVTRYAEIENRLCTANSRLARLILSRCLQIRCRSNCTNTMRYKGKERSV